MKRRDFIAGAGAVAVTASAAAQKAGPTRRIIVLMPHPASDPAALERIAAFAQGLQRSGWTIGTDIQVDYRWAPGSPDSIRQHAAEVVALAPDAILAYGASTVAPLLQFTQKIPIVFVAVADPVGGGFVASLSRPGRNITGFASFEYTLSGKWPELLKEIAPAVTRIAVLRDGTTPSGSAQFAVIQAMAASLSVQITPVDVLADAGEIERSIAAHGQNATGGLIVAASGGATVHRNVIIAAAARHQVPAMYFERSFVSTGGLISYGSNHVEPLGRAAGYIARILNGEKPADLPVQAPTKYELAINLNTAKKLGLAVPSALVARADEVVE